MPISRSPSMTSRNSKENSIISFNVLNSQSMSEPMNSFNRPSHSPSLLRLLSLVTGIATLCPSQHTEAAGAITGVEGITLVSI
jgi:hypothetical protein